MRIKSYSGGVTLFIFCSISIALVAGCPMLTAPPAMSAPTLAAGSEQLTAAWIDPATWNWGSNSNAGNDITSYNLRYSEVGSGSWTEITSGITGTSHVITELTNGDTYHVQVRAVNAQGTGGWSASSTATPIAPPTAPPTAPGTMAAPTLEPGNKRLLVTWSAPADNGGSEITAYHLRHSADGGTNWSELITLAAPAASYPIRGLRNGTSYEVQARAVNNEGAGTWSEIATETPVIVAAQQTPAGTAASLSLSAANTAIIARENPTVKLTTVEPGTLAVNEISETITVTPATAPNGVTIPTVDADTGLITVTASTTAGTYLVYGTGTGDTILFAEYLSVTLSPTTNAQLKTAVTSAIGDQNDNNDSGIWGNTANLNYIITTAVTDMTSIFVSQNAFNGDISLWDVGSVTNMDLAFFGTEAFNGDISRWDVSSVMTMSNMFNRAIVFNNDISGWNVSSVTNMNAMFNIASAFNQNLEAWKDHWTLNTSGKYTGTTTNMFNSSGLDVDTDPNTDGKQPNFPSWYE
ncbi:MAG: BspA family leucine-rich repeat surface protein [Salinispira sp.]